MSFYLHELFNLDDDEETETPDEPDVDEDYDQWEELYHQLSSVYAGNIGPILTY